MKKLILLGALTISSFGAFAQVKIEPIKKQETPKEQVVLNESKEAESDSKKIGEMKFRYLLDNYHLSEDDSTFFFNAYMQYLDETQRISYQFYQSEEAILSKSKKEPLTDDDYKALIDLMTEKNNVLADVRTTFLQGLSAKLTYEEIYDFLILEKRFSVEKK